MIRCRYIHAEKEWKSIVIDQWKSLMAPPSVNSQRRFASKLHTHTACRNPSRHRIRSPFTLPPHAAPFIDYTLITSHSQHFEFIAAVNQSALFVRLAPSKSDWITLLCLSVLHRKSYSFHQPAVCNQQQQFVILLYWLNNKAFHFHSFQLSVRRKCSFLSEFNFPFLCRK